MDYPALSMYAQCSEQVFFCAAVSLRPFDASVGFDKALSPRSGVGLSDPELLTTNPTLTLSRHAYARYDSLMP